MTFLERMAEVDRLADGSQHSRECVDRAAQRAWNNDTTIADYPSPEATQAGATVALSARERVVTVDGKARTAAATAKRVRTKHDRWIAELSGAGWSVIQASAVVLTASVVDDSNGNRVVRPHLRGEIVSEHEVVVTFRDAPSVAYAGVVAWEIAGFNGDWLVLDHETGERAAYRLGDDAIAVAGPSAAERRERSEPPK